MRRRRLAGLAFAVAALAVGATAPLLGSGTSAPDPAIRSALLTYANEHRSWAGVDSLVRQLADLTGQRVALTTPNGELIADSGSGGLPSATATRIDAAAAPTAEIEPQPNVVAGDPGRGASLTYYQWQLTDAEREQRQALAEQAVDCLRANTRQDGHARPRQRHQLLLGAAGGGEAAPRSPAMDSCVPDALEQPTAAARELAASIAERAGACLDEHGLEYETATGAGGLPVFRSEPAVENSSTWKACTRSAAVAAKREYVAPAADLYVSAVADGRLRTGAIVAAALLGAAALMALTVRRVDRPVLLGEVAHELRSPLANVRTQLEAAQDGVLPFDRRLIQTLIGESTLLERLVDDLQDLALADAGKLRVHPEACDAVDLAAQAVAAHQARAHAGGVQLRVAADRPVPAYADPARIRQVLSNLVSNALRHTPEGGRVEITARRGPGVVVLAVTDDGSGIEPSHLPRVFDRFYRAGSRPGGAGLGLAIAKRLVEAHGGRVEVTSAPGEGSTFAISLPVPDELGRSPGL